MEEERQKTKSKYKAKRMIEGFQKLGIELNGNNSKVQCPKCLAMGKSRNECLSLNFEKGLFNCHRCYWAGSVNTPQNQQKAPLNRIIEKKQGEYKPAQTKELTRSVIEFFKKRGISENTLRKEHVKCADRFFSKYQQVVNNVIAFQFIKNNQRVNTKYRTADKDMSQDKGGEKCFYRFDKLKGAKNIYITEGEIDALTLIECGFDIGVVSVPDGAPNPSKNSLENKFSFLDEETEKIFEEAENVILVTDNDVNGKFLESELKRRIGIDKCLTIIYPDRCKDINEVLIEYGKEAVIDIIESAEHCPVSGLKTFKDYENEIFNMYNGVSGNFYKTGWRDMDKHLKIKTGQLNIVTGVPGSGKSEWVDALMINTINSDGLKWAVFSPENYPPQVYFRKLAEKLNSKSFDYFNDSSLQSSIKYLSENIHLIVDNDEDDVTIDYLFQRIKTLVFRHGVKGVIIDPWNEILHDIGSREDLYLNKTLRKIKRFIRKHDLTLWLVAHPKNPAKDKDGNYYRITAYDIAGGYAWFAKADNVFSVWRNKTDNSKPLEVEIQKIKQKTDGNLGTCYFFYQYDSGQFKSYKSSLDKVVINDEDYEDIYKEEF